MQISGRHLPVLIVLLLCSCETTNYASNNVGADSSFSSVGAPVDTGNDDRSENSGSGSSGQSSSSSFGF